MDNLLNLLVGLKSVIWGTVLVVGVVIALGILNKILQKNSAQMTGRRFRNQLLMSGGVFLGLVVIILVLPIDATMRGQLLSLVGIIISAGIALSSSTILGNAMAGIMLKTVRNFHSGDFVKIEDYFGRVTERGLFHTEIQTADRDLVTLPNMYLATTPVRVIRSSGTVISATVSLGYDIPHHKIEEILLKAAADIGLKDPFVQILDLGDFSVNYRIAGLLEEAKKLLAFRSRLRAGILDSLHAGGVEIVSPDFRNVRNFEMDKSFIPTAVRIKKDLPQDAAPVDVVYDKAEVAASKSALEKEKSELEGKLKEARQASKGAKEDRDKELAERQGAQIERRLDEIAEGLAQTQEKEKEHDL